MEYSIMYHHGIQSPMARQDHHSNIDPSLAGPESWNHPMQRYLSENPPIFNSAQVPQPGHPQGALMSPINTHPTVHYRNSSPVSNQTSGESEHTYADHMPPTPPGSTSPFIGFQSSDNMYHFTGLATLTTDHSYISPATMPPSAMDLYDHSSAYSNTQMASDFSLDSLVGPIIDDSTAPAASAPKILMSQRHLSPPNVPEEMLMTSTAPLATVPQTPITTIPTPPRQTSPYPSLSGPSDGDDDDETHNVHEDDDSDYSPNGRRKRTRQVAPNHKKRPGPQTPDSSSHPKRQRPNSRGEPYAPLSTTGPISCTECRAPGQTFKSLADLQKHMRQQHTRPFVCVFNFAGCASTFASKNEWKRHVASQHLLLNFWLCTEGACGKVDNSHTNSPQLPQGAIFNRKDLYTQHVRRMHTVRTVNPKKKGGKKAAVKEETAAGIDDRLKNMQVAAHRERCRLPTQMSCPAVRCSHEFRGQNAWDERMEHVAKHLERSATRRAEWTSHSAWQQQGNDGEDEDGDEIEFGGPNDPTLVTWASRADVAVIRRGAAGNWELWNPLRGEGANSAALGNHKRASFGGAPTQQIVIQQQHFVEGEDDAEGDDE